MIEAVPHRHLICPAHLMVDLAEESGAVNRIGIDAGCHLSALVADSRESGVDHWHVWLEDRDKTGLIEPSLLEIREVERAIADEWTAEAGAILLLIHRQCLA